jgi:hypothetical protein
VVEVNLMAMMILNEMMAESKIVGMYAEVLDVKYQVKRMCEHGLSEHCHKQWAHRCTTPCLLKRMIVRE